MVYVLNVLAEVAPDWVRAWVPTDWSERYGERLEHERLPPAEDERTQYANQVGTDGWRLLAALDAPLTPDWLKTLPATTTLRQIWAQQFEPLEQGESWLAEPVLAAPERINSPYDLEARTGGKRATFWGATKSTSPKPVMKMSHSSLPMSRRLMRASPMGRRSLPSMLL